MNRSVTQTSTTAEVGARRPVVMKSATSDAWGKSSKASAASGDWERRPVVSNGGWDKPRSRIAAHHSTPRNSEKAQAAGFSEKTGTHSEYGNGRSPIAARAFPWGPLSK